MEAYALHKIPGAMDRFFTTTGYPATSAFITSQLKFPTRLQVDPHRHFLFGVAYVRYPLPPLVF